MVWEKTGSVILKPGPKAVPNEFFRLEPSWLYQLHHSAFGIILPLVYSVSFGFYTSEGRVIRVHGVLGVVVAIFAFLSAVAASAQQIPENTYQDLRWRMIGPFRGGRTRAPAGVPNQPNFFYVGQVNVGFWKTHYYGRTCEPFLHTQPTQAIVPIAVAPSQPNILSQ